jgi:hypothetical protein
VFKKPFIIEPVGFTQCRIKQESKRWSDYVAEFQTELTLAKKMGDILDNTPRMPYGYPLQVYRPMHFCQMPKVKQFIAKTGGKLSNGVPKVLSGEVVGGYLLGIYNTLNNCQS